MSVTKKMQGFSLNFDVIEALNNDSKKTRVPKSVIVNDLLANNYKTEIYDIQNKKEVEEILGDIEDADQNKKQMD